MDWIILAVILAGLVVGFSLGASPTPTGGMLSASVVAFFAGIAGGKCDNTDFQYVGKIASLFIIVLFVTYIVTNILRRKKLLVLLGFRGPPDKK